MKVLIIGGGGREHALAWKVTQSPQVTEVFCAPGNPGIAEIATCVPIKADDVQALVDFAKRERIDLTIVGPELPLTLGIVDSFKRVGLAAFGPSREAAVLEGSKVFTKEFCKRYGIPAAQSETFTDAQQALAFIQDQTYPLVIKADGLAAGKGAVICHTAEEAQETIDAMLVRNLFGTASERIIIEEFLQGEEASFIAICDGNHVLPLASSQDHKAAYDGDAGPNTGGMGAISPARLMTPELTEQVMERIMLPTAHGMVTEGMPFVGVLYAGLMIKDGQVRVLEFNVRFGDPETQPLLMRLQTDLIEIVQATLSGTLDRVRLAWDPRPAICVVMASGGYPGSYEKGKAITGLAEAAGQEGVQVFHAGTASENDRVVTSGGRVLGVTAIGDDMADAIEQAYNVVDMIHWDGVHFRKDIGHKALEGCNAKIQNPNV